MTVIRGPPILAVRHKRVEILSHRFKIKGLKLRRVVKLLAHRVHKRRVLVKDFQIELIRPPVLVSYAASQL